MHVPRTRQPLRHTFTAANQEFPYLPFPDGIRFDELSIVLNLCSGAEVRLRGAADDMSLELEHDMVSEIIGFYSVGDWLEAARCAWYGRQALPKGFDLDGQGALVPSGETWILRLANLETPLTLAEVGQFLNAAQLVLGMACAPDTGSLAESEHEPDGRADPNQTCRHAECCAHSHHLERKTAET